MKENNGKSVNQWAALNRILFLYKVTGLGLIILSLGLTTLVFSLANSDPVVVLKEKNGITRFLGKHRPTPVTAGEIEKMISEYIKLRYVWETLDHEVIGNNISPFVTEGFQEKSEGSVKQMKEKEFNDKKVRQDVSGISVEVTEESTSATFDRILRVEGVPLIIPTEISFELVRGKANQWNPLGLFINATKIHERE